MALTLGHVDVRWVQALADTAASIAPLVMVTLANNERPTLERIVEARMNMETRKAAVESADWLTAVQIADVAEFSK